MPRPPRQPRQREQHRRQQRGGGEGEDGGGGTEEIHSAGLPEHRGRDPETAATDDFLMGMVDHEGARRRIPPGRRAPSGPAPGVAVSARSQTWPPDSLRCW
jgi:hypothetical protein